MKQINYCTPLDGINTSDTIASVEARMRCYLTELLHRNIKGLSKIELCKHNPSVKSSFLGQSDLDTTL